MISPEPKLAVTSLPQEWEISYNDLRAIDPSNVPAESPLWGMYFDEDLLQAVNRPRNRALDIGWYPACRNDGAFVLVVIRDHNWDEPLLRVQTKSINELVQTLVTLDQLV